MSDFLQKKNWFQKNPNEDTVLSDCNVEITNNANKATSYVFGISFNIQKLATARGFRLIKLQNQIP